MKYKIELGIETDKGLFDVQDLIELALKPLIAEHLISNPILYYCTEYKKLHRDFLELRGEKSGSGGRSAINIEEKSVNKFWES